MQNCTRHKLSVNAHNIRNGYNGYFWIIGERKFMSKCIFEWICSFERYLKVCSVFKLVEYTFLKYGMLTSNPTRPKPCSTFTILQFKYKVYLWNPNHLKPCNNAFNKSPKTMYEIKYTIYKLHCRLIFLWTYETDIWLGQSMMLNETWSC